MDLAEEIKAALRRLHRINKREEMAAFDRSMFVDNRQITQLDTNDWQVLFGRRGTGKTTLLSAFSDYIVQREDAVYTIFIDLRECVPSASGVTRGPETDFELALGYFYEFVKRFSRLLLDEYTDGSDLSALQRLVRHVRGSHKGLDDLVLDICEIAEYQPVRALPVERTVETKASQERKGSSEASAGGGVEANLAGAKATANGRRKISLENESSSGQTENERFIFEASRRYQPLKRKLEQLLEQIEANRLYILIDEWADLNRIQEDQVQAIFAELLRKTFGGSEKISVKIASIKGATRMNIWNGQGGIGLEVGADIFEACDLDQVYISDENSLTFFKRLLFKRMCKANPALAEFSLKNERDEIILEPPDNFFSYFLKDDEAFSDIVKGSGKIPRDFVSLFCYVSHAVNFEIAPAWRRGQVLKIISEFSIQNKHDIVSTGDEKGQLFYRIVENAKDTGSRVFLVSRKLSEEARELVNDLYHLRLIHPVTPSIVPLKVRMEQDCFYVDYGYFLEAAEYIPSGAAPTGCPFDDSVTVDQIKKYSVAIEDLVGETVTCLHADCGEVFRDTSPSYRKQKLCPECFRNPLIGKLDTTV